MAGRPRMRQLVADIEAKEEGEEWVFDQLAEGRTVADIATELGVNRRYLYQWRNRKGHKERLKPLWEAAIKMSAEADLENSLQHFDRLDRVISTDPDGTVHHRIPASSEVQLVTGKAKFRQWLAARKDPERFGDKDAGIHLNFNIGDLHVDAVQAAKQRHRIEASAPEDDLVDLLEGEGYEVVEGAEAVRQAITDAAGEDDDVEGLAALMGG